MTAWHRIDGPNPPPKDGLFAAADLPEAPAPGDIPWCGYPAPKQPARGCWSWLNGWITKREDCAACAFAIPEPPHD